MRVPTLLSVVSTAVANTNKFHIDDASMLQRNVKTIEVTRATARKSDPAICTVTGDPHISFFDLGKGSEGQKAHCFGPIGDYELVKTQNGELEISGRYRGFGIDDCSEDDQLAGKCLPGMASIGGIHISGSLLGGNTISIPALPYADSLPLGVKQPGGAVVDLRHNCLPWGEWKAACLVKKRRELGVSKLGRKWRQHCGPTIRDAQCPDPLVTQFRTFNISHGTGPAAYVLKDGCGAGGRLHHKQRMAMKQCGHCKCHTNTYQIDLEGGDKILINQGEEQQFAAILNPSWQNKVSGHCGNFNSDASDDKIEEFKCPNRITDPNRPIQKDWKKNPLDGFPVRSPECKFSAQFHKFCKKDVAEEDVPGCVIQCCRDATGKDTGVVCEVKLEDGQSVLPPEIERIIKDELPAEPPAKVSKPTDPEKKLGLDKDCHWSVRQIVREICVKDVEESGVAKEEFESRVADCELDCCVDREQCPDRSGSLHCTVTGDPHIKTWDSNARDVGVYFKHDDYWLVNTDGLQIQGRYSSADPSQNFMASLKGVALTGPLLGVGDDEDDRGPVIEVPILETGGTNKVLIDGVAHITTVDTENFKIEFGEANYVNQYFDEEKVWHGDKLIKIPNKLRKQPNSVIITIKKHGFQLGKLIINNAKAQDLLVEVDSVLLDINSGYTSKVSGHCGNANNNPDDDKQNENDGDQKVATTDCLFQEKTFPGQGDGCSDCHLPKTYAKRHKDEMKCFWYHFSGDPHEKSLQADITSCVVDCFGYYKENDERPYEKVGWAQSSNPCPEP